ncbi:MAG: FAD-binding oxidoreductase [Hyphomicrobiales bacterium]
MGAWFSNYNFVCNCDILMSHSPSQKYTSWGRVKTAKSPVFLPIYRDQLVKIFKENPDVKLLATGLKRSYGDSVLNSSGALVDMKRLDRIISLDAEKGILKAEAGATISEILTLIVPKGWFLSTTPGTRFVTLGGAIANDIHGKNHHMAGSMGCSVRNLTLVRSQEGVLQISPEVNKGLFLATIAGLGLTGLIESASISLSKINSAYLKVKRVPFQSIQEYLELAKSHQTEYEHTVAWIDCTCSSSKRGRGIFQSANWCNDGDLEPHNNAMGISVPVDFPNLALNGFTVSVFNKLYYTLQKKKKGLRREHYSSFFYPLDGVRNWNRIYGSRGFYQYQCIVPFEGAKVHLEKLLALIAEANTGSFLAVLKTLGSKHSSGLLSFSRPGVTLALDFPNNGKKTLKLLAKLDEVVRDCQGALYPAKDGRMSKEMFELSFSRNQEFKEYIDPALTSDFWSRVSGFQDKKIMEI